MFRPIAPIVAESVIAGAMAGATTGAGTLTDALPMGTPDDRCTLLAGEQHGCISLPQALDCGLSRESVFRRVRSRRWERLLPGVYTIRGAPPTWEQRLMAATLWAGEGAALAGASAAALWRFPGFGPGPVEVVHPGTKHSRRGLVVRRVQLGPGDVTRLDRFVLTSPARTLLDVACRLVRTRFDVAFHYCLHERLATTRDLQDLAARAPVPGLRKLKESLGAYAGDRPAGSPLEAKLARLLRTSGLPAPRRQHPVRIAGRTRYLDFAWPSARVAVEADGYRWHSSRGAWESDRARLRELRRAGWTVIQVTHEDVVRGFDRLAEELAPLVAPAVAESATDGAMG